MYDNGSQMEATFIKEIVQLIMLLLNIERNFIM